MSDRKITLCLGCMRQKDENTEICPHCGYKYAPETQGKTLLPKTVLKDRYIIGRTLLKDSDGLTYIGFDVSTESRIEVKEFFPEVLCDRKEDGTVAPKSGREVLFKTMKSEFSDLQLKIQKLKTSNSLPRVFDVFEDKGTVYCISERKELIKFSDYLTFENEDFTWEKVKEMFFPLLTTLATVNDAGIIHRLISPETIYVDKYSNLHIHGFCTESLLEYAQNSDPDNIMGYEAPEMFVQNAETGFYTDVYSLGAVMYRTLAGIAPVSAKDRLGGTELPTLRQINPMITEKVSDIIYRAMALDPLDRIRSIRGFIEIINAALQEKEPEKVIDLAQKKKNAKKITGILIAVFVVVFLGLVFGIAYMLFNPSGAPNNDPPAISSEVSSSPSSSVDEDIISAASEVSSLAGGRFYAVPGFVGTTKYTEINPSYLERFTFEATYEYSDEYAEGIIIKQTPAENEPLELYGTIKVVVSKGPHYLDIPETEGVDIDTYTETLISIGYTEDKIVTAEVQGKPEDAGKIMAVFLENGENKIDVENYSKIYVIYYTKEKVKD